MLKLKNGKEFLLKKGDNTIGRDGDINIPDDNYISKVHAKIVLHNNKCTIHDLGSKNGTYINKTKVSSASPLTHKDQILCGKTKFVFCQELIE